MTAELRDLLAPRRRRGMRGPGSGVSSALIFLCFGQCPHLRCGLTTAVLSQVCQQLRLPDGVCGLHTAGTGGASLTGGVERW